MYRIFGKSKPAAAPAPPPDIDGHVSRLNSKVPELDAKIAQIDKEVLELKRRLAATRAPSQQNAIKQQAMTLLRRKKMYEQQRGSYQTRAFNMEQTQFALGMVKDAQEQAAAVKFMAGQLKEEQGKIDLDALEDAHLDMEDLLVDAEEINEIMSRDYNLGAAVNEDDLNAEFAALDGELDAIPDAAPGVGAGAEAASAYGGPSASAAAAGGVPTGSAAVPAGGIEAELMGLMGDGGGGGGGYGGGGRGGGGAFPAVPTHSGAAAAQQRAPALAGSAGMYGR